MRLEKAVHTSLGALATYILWNGFAVVAAIDQLKTGPWVVWMNGAKAGTFVSMMAAVGKAKTLWVSST